MIVFWIVIILMCLLAVSFIAWPVLITKNVSLNNVEHGMVIIAAVAICTLAPVLYWHWGSSKQLNQRWVVEQRAAALRAELGTPAKVIAQLKQRLAADPASSQGWYLLGKLYFSQQHFNAAANAYAKANALQPKDVDIMVQYAQALYFAKQHKMNKQIAMLLQQVLQLQPNNGLAINLLAIDAYQHKRYQQAINFWQKLLNQYPPASEDYQALQTAMENARLALKQSGALASKISVQVKVTLAANLKSKVEPADTLFIYARAAKGSAMPLAIARGIAKDLPRTVTLDESMAMNPAQTLASAKEVIIIARISRSGNARSQQGDLEGRSEIVKMPFGQRMITVEIDKVL